MPLIDIAAGGLESAFATVEAATTRTLRIASSPEAMMLQQHTAAQPATHGDALAYMDPATGISYSVGGIGIGAGVLA